MLEVATYNPLAEVTSSRFQNTDTERCIVTGNVCSVAEGDVAQTGTRRNGPRIIRLPDTVEGWPWPRAINKHYEEAKAESTAWLKGFYPFDADGQRKFDACDFSLLASLAYPWLSKEHIRTGCDLMMIFFVFDEYSDVEGEYEVQKQADIIMDALRDPYKSRPAGENLLGEATRQFWQLALKTASPTAARRYVDAFGHYVQSVVEQAKDRDRNYIRSIDEYFSVRRLTVGARPSFAIMELAADFPAAVWENPVMELITVCVIDMIILDNDMLSYNVEQARGDDAHNIIRIVIDQLNTDVEGALKWLEGYHNQCKKTFLDNYQKVPSFGPEIDPHVRLYIQGLGNWVIANVSWSFESARYFGKEGSKIREHRMIHFVPNEN